MKIQKLKNGGERYYPPDYQLIMRGTEAIRIIYEGQDLGVFDIQHLWIEYRKTIEPNDPNKRYVIERAIETFEGKIPRVIKRAKTRHGEFVPIWNSFTLGRSPGRYPIEAKIRKGRGSLFWALLAKLRRLRF